jgi:hypothetical protein
MLVPHNRYSKMSECNFSALVKYTGNRSVGKSEIESDIEDLTATDVYPTMSSEVRKAARMLRQE